MLIYNQDLDQQVDYSPAADTLHTLIMYHNDIFMGVNLLLNDELLGTFDTVQETVNEMQTIIDWPYEIYSVSGCTLLWENWTDLCEMMMK